MTQARVIWDEGTFQDYILRPCLKNKNNKKPQKQINKEERMKGRKEEKRKVSKQEKNASKLQRANQEAALLRGVCFSSCRWIPALSSHPDFSR